MLDLNAIEGFDWDAGNRDKVRARHGVEPAECEMAFFNEPLVLLDDVKHSQAEARYYAFGKTDAGRLLLIVFCVRKYLIRVISARTMHWKERRFYEGQA